AGAAVLARPVLASPVLASPVLASHGLGGPAARFVLAGRPLLAAPGTTVRPVGRARPSAAPALSGCGRALPATTRTPPGPPAPRGGLALGAALRGVTTVNPALHADPAERGASLVEAVVNVSAQRVQGNPAFAVELGPRHLSTAETA